MHVKNRKRIGGTLPPGALNHNALAILGCIIEATHNDKPAPTRRDIMAVLGFKWTNGLEYHLKRLKKLGLISESPTQAHRTLRPTCQFLWVDAPARPE